jgi:hypothetical protein
VHWKYLPASGELRLIVQNDGKGFVQDPKAATGLGLVTIRDYADSLNGRFQIESTPGKGTVVTLWLPAGLEVSPLDLPFSASVASTQGAQVARGFEPNGALALQPGRTDSVRTAGRA